MKQVATLLVLLIVVLLCLPFVPMWGDLWAQPTAVSWNPGVLFTAVGMLPLRVRRK